MGTRLKALAIVLALAIGAVIAYGLIRSVDEQETANCIAAAEARYPVAVLPETGDSDSPLGLANFDVRQEAVDAC